MIMGSSDETFARDVLNAGEPTLVDFWAPWCGHCRRLEPVLEQMSDDGQRIVKVNIDLSPFVTRQYGVGSIPALFYFQNGKPGDMLLGPGSRADIEDWIDAQRS